MEVVSLVIEKITIELSLIYVNNNYIRSIHLSL